MGTNFTSLFTDLFFYSYKAEIMQWLLNKIEKKLA